MILTENNTCYTVPSDRYSHEASLIIQNIKEIKKIDNYKGNELFTKVIVEESYYKYNPNDFTSYISEDNEKFEFKAIYEEELKTYQGLKNYSFCLFYPGKTRGSQT